MEADRKKIRTVTGDCQTHCWPVPAQATSKFQLSTSDASPHCKALGQISKLSAGIAAPHHRQIVELPSLCRFRAGKCHMTRAGFAVAVIAFVSTVALMPETCCSSAQARIRKLRRR
jgi:hypothetical protein